MIKYIVAALISLLFFGCFEETDSADSEKLVGPENVVDSSDYVYRAYHPNDSLKYVVRKLDGLSHGWAYWYYPDGQLKGKIYFHKGIKIGIGRFYFDQGPIETYLCYYALGTEFEGEVFYRSDYKKNGDLIEDQGVYFPKLVTSERRVTLGETFWIELYVARPPHAIAEVIIDEKPVSLDENSSYYLIERVFSEVGQHKISIKVVIHNKLTGEKSIDSNDVYVEVV